MNWALLAALSALAVVVVSLILSQRSVKRDHERVRQIAEHARRDDLLNPANLKPQRAASPAASSPREAPLSPPKQVAASIAGLRAFFDLELLIDATLVVGLNHRIGNASKLNEAIRDPLNDDLYFALQREPDNPFDEYAIKVIARWRDQYGARKSAHVGYLSKEMAWKVGHETDDEDKLFGEFVSIEPHAQYGYDLRIDIYVQYAF